MQGGEIPSCGTETQASMENNPAAQWHEKEQMNNKRTSLQNKALMSRWPSQAG